tara:strand:- start:465 stop:641 length:177 start_codon:yes stop_codon:yes gene_type:complete
MAEIPFDVTFSLKEIAKLQKQLLDEIKLLNKQITNTNKQFSKPIADALKNGIKMKGLK